MGELSLNIAAKNGIIELSFGGIIAAPSHGGTSCIHCYVNPSQLDREDKNFKYR